MTQPQRPNGVVRLSVLLALTILVLQLPCVAQEVTVGKALCKAEDDGFSDGFDLAALGLCLLSACVLPFAMPYALRYRYWWLTEPYGRWFLIALPAAALSYLLCVGLPWLATIKRVSPSVGLTIFPRINPAYLDCADFRFETQGLLWGFLPMIEQAAVFNVPKMSVAFVLLFALAAAVYWLLYFLLFRPSYGLKAR